MTADEILSQLVETFFNQYGIKYRKHERKSLLLGRYFNFRLKYIGLAKRTVRISKELLSCISNCPANEALFDIVYKAGEGLDLNPYQSKGAFNADVHDGLFNDWGIHHLHLSTSKKKSHDFFYDRSDYLLFVRFTDDAAYFLNTEKHKEANVWSKKEYIRIIQQNWPESIADKEVPNVQWKPDFDDWEIGELRNKGYLFGVNVDDKAYLLLGHGQTSSGDNMMAMRLSDEVLRWIHQNEYILNSDQSAFENELKKVLYIDP